METLRSWWQQNSENSEGFKILSAYAQTGTVPISGNINEDDQLIKFLVTHDHASFGPKNEATRTALLIAAKLGCGRSFRDILK